MKIEFVSPEAHAALRDLGLQYREAKIIHTLLEIAPTFEDFCRGFEKVIQPDLAGKGKYNINFSFGPQVLPVQLVLGMGYSKLRLGMLTVREQIEEGETL